jgi:hypothetical protein
MKKSTLKQLIQEVISEIENAKIQDMTKALEQNPEFVDAAMRKLNFAIDTFHFGKKKAKQLNKSKLSIKEEDDMNRRSFIGKLAKVLAGAGVAASTVANANAGQFGQLIGMADSLEDKSRDMTNQKARDLGLENPKPGSVAYIATQARNSAKFKRYRELYKATFDMDNAKEAEEKRKEVSIAAIMDAFQIIKKADNFDMKYVFADISYVTRIPYEEVKQLVRVKQN